MSHQTPPQKEMQMPYRITMSVDIPDAVPDGPTTETARAAFRCLSDMEEAVGKHNGDTQDYDVEWYAFKDADELTANSWTYADEELLDSLTWHWKAALEKNDPEFDTVEFVDGDAEDANQATRVLREFEKRQSEHPAKAPFHTHDIPPARVEEIRKAGQAMAQYIAKAVLKYGDDSEAEALIDRWDRTV